MPSVFIKEHQGAYGSIGHITLNRPGVLNSIDKSMSEKIERALQTWEACERIQAIVLTANGERAFCAGGDLNELLALSQKDTISEENFLKQSYRCIHQIASMQTPCIALCQGIVMGGGFGTMRHMHRRIGTPNLSLAMPETALGFIPDVGASHFLMHLPDGIGLYLALTGRHLNAYEAYHFGMVTQITELQHFDAIVQALIQAHWDHDPFATIDALLHPYSQPAKPVQWPDAIGNCFAQADWQAIVTNLQTANFPLAKDIMARLQERSPWSLAITLAAFRAHQKGERLADALNREYTLALHCLHHPDLKQGLARVLEKKERIDWQKEVGVETNTLDRWVKEAVISNPLAL